MNKIIDLLYPRRCPVCDRPVKPSDALICADCIGKLEKIGEPACCRCGKRLREENEEYCTDCRKTEHSYERGVSVYTYRSVSGAIYRYKYRGRREYSDFFGQACAGKIYSACRARIIPVPDLLIPVPLSAQRLKKRGYNQAELVAGSVSKLTGIPLGKDVLLRKRGTPPLKGMTALQRHKIMENAFIASENDVKSKITMLIDDVYTTGATMDACADCLLAAGAEKVYFCTIASGEDLSC